VEGIILIKNYVELLAPAGSFEAMIAAVNNGADAVYLGGKAFGARYYASNFDDQDLIKATNYIHHNGKKIYVTVNTLIADNELESVARYLKFLCELGIDAVIIQDLGLLKMLKELFPVMEVHASTQMTINNSSGINYLEKYGVSRVVLAREMSLENIKKIRKRTKLELETFIHGALCVCYSGQCLMSSMIGGRSGNRGKCAQPCRLKYGLTDDRNRRIELGSVGEHLLSPKDLSTIEFLPEIIEAGVTSLKIEGRMKRPEYVATVTRIYRAALDRYFEGILPYKISEEERKELAQIFNRDFTSGYYKAYQGSDLMSYKRPNNRGIFLGRISSVQPKKNQATIKLAEELNIGDGIEIWVTHGGRKGLTVEKIWLNGKPVARVQANQEATIEIKEKVFVGDRVFKTYDAKLMKKAQETIKYKEADLKVPVKMEVTAKEGSPLLLTIIDEAGRVAQAETSFITERAIKRPLTLEIVKEQLERLGNTPYYLTKLTCNLEGNIMVPLSELNEVRRQAVAELEKIRKDAVKQNIVSDEEIFHYVRRLERKENNLIHSPVLSVFVSTVEGGIRAVATGANRIYLNVYPWRSLGKKEENIHDLIKMAQGKKAELVIALPRLWQENEREKIERLIDKFEQEKINGFLVGNLGTLELLNEMKNKQKIYLDYPLNVFNSLAFKFLMQNDRVTCITLSPEMSFEQLRQLNLPETVQQECIIHGSLPLMISEYCAVGALLGGKTAETVCTKPCLGRHYGLKDRLNLVFPLEMDTACRMHIFNSKDLCLLEDLGRFMTFGVNCLRIEARRYSPEEIGLVVTTYKKGLEAIKHKENPDRILSQLKDQLEHYWKDSFTKGHYYRGVL